MSASPNHTYSNNILGNTTEINGFDLEWDLLNRLTLMKDGSNESIWQVYKYRADGMRVSQVDDYQNTTKRFRYDGQMPVETAAFDGTSSLTWTSTARNILGARGIDALSTETSGGTVSTYPLYDTHGNVKAYVKKESSNTWSSLGWKQYNVWGGVRSSSGGAGTTSAYCGNLGHVSDFETGLIYMRARYYAPWAGRFISEDPARDGGNWFTYCENEPVNAVDADGKSPESEAMAVLGDVLKFVGLSLMLGAAIDARAMGSWLGAMDRAMRVAQKVGNSRSASLYARAIYFCKAFSVSKIWNSGAVVRNLGTAVLGYSMMIYGAFLDMMAEFEDPYGNNSGLTEAF